MIQNTNTNSVFVANCPSYLYMYLLFSVVFVAWGVANLILLVDSFSLVLCLFERFWFVRQAKEKRKGIFVKSYFVND